MNQLVKNQFSAFNAPPGDPAPVETPTQIAAAIKKAIHDFQAKNDERYDELKAGVNDAVTKEHVDRLNAAITELKDMADANAKNVSRLAIGGAGGGDVKNERKYAAQFLSLTSGKRVTASDSNLDVDAYRNYKSAFEELVISNFNAEQLTPDMRAALSVGSEKDGGQFVPPEISTEMEKRVHDSSPMRQIGRVITIGSKSWEAPYKSTKGVSGGWVGEKQDRTKTGTSEYGMQEIKAHEQYAYPEITQDMLEDASINIEAMLIEDTEDEMSRNENLAFVSGNGVMRPRGYLDYKSASTTAKDNARDWGILQHLITGAAAGFPKVGATAADDTGVFIKAIAALNPTYRPGAVWTMNRQTEADVRSLRDDQGRYLVGFGDMQDNTTGFNLHGFNIVNFEDMPDLGADSFSIAFGNFRRGYFIIDRRGFRLIRDELTNKPMVGFYITKRVGGDVRNFDAIKLIKTSA